MKLDRREFFVRSSFAAGSVTMLPQWIAAAFQPQDKPKEPERVTALRAAQRRALASGKPLLVLVVPEEPRARYARGEVLGAFVNHGGRDALFELAATEPVCATLVELKTVTGFAFHGGEPLMLLLEPATPLPEGDGPPPLLATTIDPDLPEPWDRVAVGTEKWLQLETERLETSTTMISQALHTAVAPEAVALQRRAATVRARLTTDDLAELERFMVGGPAPSDSLVLRAAAALRAAGAAHDGAARARLLDPLAAVATQTLVTARIPGSKWAHSGGCGTSIEGEPNPVGPECGMGRVPKASERFLYFFTHDGQ